MRSFGKLLIGFLVLAGTSSIAQQCNQPPMPTFSPSTMLTVEQEGYLGDVIAQFVREDIKVIEDEDLSAPLQRIGSRLKSYAPPDSPEFHFSIVDLPMANAFTIAGGRVYVTRKAITLAKNEDEVAGLLAHEMGHVLTRQTATEFRQLFRQVLKVDSIGGREDVEERFHELLDRSATNRKAWADLFKHMERDQLSADRMSVYLATRAGYSPTKFGEYFDRLVENRGKKGNWFTDVFGNTTPDSKRYREILKGGSPIQGDCVAKAERMSAADFTKWRQGVTQYNGIGKKESLPANARKQIVQDPLREQIRHLKFSPDGNYVIAQDDSSIYVLSRGPFKTLFRIDSENAYPAQFTPDSKSVVFYTFANRVEKWDISQQQQVDVSEVYTASPCIESALSPLGDYLACLHLPGSRGIQFDLDVYNVETGESEWKQKEIFSPGFLGFFAMATEFRTKHMVDLIPLAFSPDGRYLAASNGSPFVYDFTAKKALSPSELAGIGIFVRDAFAFVGPDVILGRVGEKGEKSAVVQFPSGKVVQADVPVGPVKLYPAARGSYLILRPILHAPVGIMDLKTKKIFAANKTSAIDIYDGLIVSERTNGEIALYQTANQPPTATTQLPLGPLTNFQAVAVSPDLNYVTYSGHMRGALWSLQNGSRLFYLRGFLGAHFDEQGKMSALFPPADSYNEQGGLTKQETDERNKEKWTTEELKREGPSTALVDPVLKSIAPVSTFERRFQTLQVGPYLLLSAFCSTNGDILKERELEVQEVSSGRKLWSRKFKMNRFPAEYYNLAGNSLAFVWSAQDEEGKELLEQDASLKAKVQSIGKKSVALIEVVELDAGRRRHVVPIDTGEGSIEIRDINFVGDTLILSDNHGRFLIYDSSGNRHARIFASRPMIDRYGNLMLAGLEPGRLGLYALPSTRQINVFTFPKSVVHKQFSADAKSFVVITSDQTIYTIPIENNVVPK